VKVLFIAGWSGDTERYRAWHQAEQLWFAGVAAAVRSADDPLLLADLGDYDTFIFCRASYTPTVAAMLAVIQDRGQLALYDTDDLVFLPELAQRIDLLYQMPPADTALHLRQFAANRATLDQCDFALTSTPYLAAQVTEQTGKPAFVNRNALYDDQIIYATQQQPAFAAQPTATSNPATITICYLSGSPSHSRDFALVVPALARVMSERPEVRLLVGGYLSLPEPLFQYEGTARVQRFGFVPWRQLPSIQAQADINLAPLELDNPFAMAKSELKYFEAGVVGVPTIASPTPAFREAIRDGENGLLASGDDEWAAAIYRLLDPAERVRIGRAAFDDVFVRYTPEARSQQFLPLLEMLTERKRQQTAAQPVVGSELAYREHEAIARLKRFGAEQARLSDAELLAAHLPDYGQAASPMSGAARVQNLEDEIANLRQQLAVMQAHLTAVQSGRVMRVLNRLSGKRLAAKRDEVSRMHFTIDQAVLERFPNLYLGVVVAHGVGQDYADDEAIDFLLDQAITDLRAQYASLSALQASPGIAAWRQAFTALGINANKYPVSIEALAGRAIKGKLPHINPLVDLANSVALKYLLPIGAHDLDRTVGDITLRPAREGDLFQPLGGDDEPGEPEQLPAGEFVYVDDSNQVRTRRWVWRQGNGAKIREDSVAVFLPIDGWLGVNEEQVRAATDELAKLVHEQLGGQVRTFHLDRQHPRCSWPDDDLDLADPLISDMSEIIGDQASQPLPTAPPEAEKMLAPPKISTDEVAIQDILTRGVVDVIVREDLAKLLRSGRQLRVKLGIDPTSSKIHIGRAVAIRKLRQFQKLGHQAVIIIGDVTGQLGDASDKDATRPMLTAAQVGQNMATYIDQIRSILDQGEVEFRFNSEWLGQMNFAALIGLASQFTVAQMIQRENFKQRWEDDKPIGLQEFLYPLMQGYDSVAVRADIELGGTDQLFNLTAGRVIQKAYGQNPQQIITNMMIMGLDGRKMSSSWGNTINIIDAPADMYGKVMSLSDEQIVDYFVATTEVPLAEIEQIRVDLAAGQNPMLAKKRLASEIVRLYHGDVGAEAGAQHFATVFQDKGLPDEIPTAQLACESTNILDLLLKCGLAPSRKEARRLVEQGGVSLDEQKVSDPNASVEPVAGLIVRAGKRRFVKIECS